jgi:hypothetical protein
MLSKPTESLALLVADLKPICGRLRTKCQNCERNMVGVAGCRHRVTNSPKGTADTLVPEE